MLVFQDDFTVEILVEPLWQVLLEEIADPDDAENHRDGNQAQPKGLLQHADGQGLERDVLDSPVALGT